MLVYSAILAQCTQSRFKEETEVAMRMLRKLSKLILNESSFEGIKYVRIEPEHMEIVVCIDAAFATNKDRSSQIGVLTMMRNRTTGAANIVHYSSTKSKRVCKSALAAEIFALVDGFKIGYTVAHFMSELLMRKVTLTLYTASQSLYRLCISLAQTTERRLQIDLTLIREAYEKRDITDIMWISGKQNPADGLT